MIYKSDGTALSDDTVNNDITEFCIWIDHNSNWIRYPTAGWEVTSGGWYSYTLPEFEKGVNWDHGDQYLVQVNGNGWSELNLNCTSHGTGSTDVTGIPNEGLNEFTPEGSIYNILNWDDTSNLATSDNAQQWDVISSNIDLAPANITINSILYPGPYLQPEIGPVIVDLNSTINISAKVANLGAPGIIKPHTLIMIDESDNNNVLSSKVIDSIGAHATAPATDINAVWHSPSVSGDYYVNVTVDHHDNLTETDESNNFVKIMFSVKSIDLTPWDVKVNGIEYTAPRTVSIGALVNISARVKNTGTLNIDDTFSLTIIDLDSDTSNSVDVEGLGPGEVSTDRIEVEWTPDTPGTYIFNVTVDLPRDIIQEFNETNNILTVTIFVEGPDLVPWEVKINGIPYNSPRTVSLGSTVTFSGKAKNIGYLDVTETFGLRLVEGKNDIIGELAIDQLGVDEISPETLEYEWIPDELGRHTFNVTVDLPKSNILEFNENNNMVYLELIVVGSLTVDIVKTVDKVKADPGDELTYVIYFNNTGDYTISLVKINDTLPEGLVYMEDNADRESGLISQVTIGNLLMYEFINIKSGSHSFIITAKINTSVKGGTELENWVSMDYQDEDGNLLTGLIGYARTVVMAPSLRIDKSVDKNSTGPNGILTYTMHFNNSGDTLAATVRIIDILPDGLSYIDDTSLNLSNYAYRDINGSALEFVFTNVDVGDYNFTITVKINRNVTTNISIDNWVTLNYTDARGNELDGVRDNATVWIDAGGSIIILTWPTSESELETNYKPIISLLICAVLVAVSLMVGFNQPLRLISREMTDLELVKLDQETKREILLHDRIFTCLILALPIPLLEGIIGIVSYYTEFLMIPPWWGAGMAVNLVIFIIGIVLNLFVVWKGQNGSFMEEEI
jgi:uncharacterized repeat protein (TIGR01451 family)